MKAVSRSHISFGKRIKELRAKRGITQEDLADKIDVDRSYIGFLERGERNPTLTKILKIAKALKVSASELLKNIQ